MFKSYQHRYSLKADKAFSLLELLAVLSLVAIVSGVASVNLYAMWQLQLLKDDHKSLSQFIQYARLTSLQKQSVINICWSTACGSETGLIIYRDVNQDKVWQQSDTLLTQWSMHHTNELRFNRGEQISFNLAGNTGQSGTLILCPTHTTNDDLLGLALVVSSTGRIRATKEVCD